MSRRRGRQGQPRRSKLDPQRDFLLALVEQTPDMTISSISIPTKIVFIDETGAATNMARLRGRAQKGTRLRVGIPQDHGKTTTFVAGLRA